MKEDWAALACFLHVALGSKSERSSNPKNTKGFLDMKCMLMAVLRKKKIISVRELRNSEASSG